MEAGHAVAAGFAEACKWFNYNGCGEELYAPTFNLGFLEGQGILWCAIYEEQYRSLSLA